MRQKWIKLNSLLELPEASQLRNEFLQLWFYYWGMAFFPELIGNVILLLHTIFKYMERSTSWHVSFQITAAEQNGYGFLLSIQKLIADGTNYRWKRQAFY